MEIWLRFQYITDDAINGPGLCIRDLAVVGEGTSMAQDWIADGFVFTHNRVRQDYIVQLIQAGDENLVVKMKLDENNTGNLTVEEPQDFDRSILVVQSLAPNTRELASYSLTLESLY